MSRILRRSGAVSLLILCAFVAAYGGEGDRDWPNWRGQKQNGTWQDEQVFRFDEGYGLKLAWKKSLGSSYSSISVADGRAITMFSDSTFDYVVALDANNGTELWRYKIDSTYVGHNSSHDGQISTPAIAGDKVYVYGRKAEVLALDATSGAVVWQKNARAAFDPLEPFHGFGSSPVVIGDVLAVLVGGKNGGAVAGFNKETGEQLWAAGTDTINYQSPIAATINGNDVLLCAGDNRVNAAVPATGEVLWEYRHGGRSGSINPVMVGDNKLFLNYNFRESMMLEISQDGGSYDVKELWKTRNIRQTFNTSVYQDGYLYGYGGRFLSAVNAETGESAWKSRPPGDGFLIVVDNHLVIITKQGTLHVAKASPEEYVELASLEVFDNLTWTPPSFSNGRIYARSLREIAAIDIAPVDQLTQVEQAEFKLINPSGEFAKRVQEINKASAGEKSKLAEAFINEQKHFPVVEDDRFAHVLFYGEAKDIAITGDMLTSGQEQVLRRVDGTDLFFASFELEPDARLDYVLRKDFDQLMTDPRNPNKVGTTTMRQVNEASELSMGKWRRPDHLAEPAGARGTIETFEFESTVLQNKRNIHVYLPHGYADSNDRYPSVYVNYGNFAKDMALMPNTLDNLIAAKRIRPVITVFVEAPNSFQEYARQNRDTHAEMFAKELVPHIDGKYHTLANAESRMIMGGDEGGYAAIHTAFRYPGTAAMIAGQSTHLFPAGGGNELVELVRSSEKFGIRFYLDWSTYDQRGGGFDWKDLNKNFVKLLHEKGYDVVTDEVHEGFGWGSWRNRTDRILEMFAGSNQTRK